MSNPSLAQIVAAITPLFEDAAPVVQAPLAAAPQAPAPASPYPFSGGRTQLVTTFPWANVRLTSPGVLSDSNIWLIRFVAGAAQRDVTLQAAESSGGGIPRASQLIRDHDGVVLATQSGTTITQPMTFNPVKPTGIFASVYAHPIIEPGVAYTLAITNKPGNGAGPMFIELIL